VTGIVVKSTPLSVRITSSLKKAVNQSINKRTGAKNADKFFNNLKLSLIKDTVKATLKY